MPKEARSQNMWNNLIISSLHLTPDRYHIGSSDDLVVKAGPANISFLKPFSNRVGQLHVWSPHDSQTPLPTVKLPYAVTNRGVRYRPNNQAGLGDIRVWMPVERGGRSDDRLLAIYAPVPQSQGCLQIADVKCQLHGEQEEAITFHRSKAPLDYEVFFSNKWKSPSSLQLVEDQINQYLKDLPELLPDSIHGPTVMSNILSLLNSSPEDVQTVLHSLRFLQGE